MKFIIVLLIFMASMNGANAGWYFSKATDEQKEGAYRDCNRYKSCTLTLEEIAHWNELKEKLHREKYKAEKKAQEERAKQKPIDTSTWKDAGNADRWVTPY